MYKVDLADAELFALCDTHFDVEPRQVYPGVSDDDEAFGSTALDFGSPFAMPCMAFAVRTDGHTLLIDTGYGRPHDGRLLDELAEADIGTDEIDTIVFTHLHGDHTGWNLNDSEPVFSCARYLISEPDRHELDSGESMSSTLSSDIAPLQQSGQLGVVKAGDVIAGRVAVRGTPGHAPGHLTFELASEDRAVVFSGDIILTELDVEFPMLENCYDADPTSAMRTRMTFLEQVADTGAMVATSHLTDPGLGFVVRSDTGYRWQSVTA